MVSHKFSVLMLLLSLFAVSQAWAGNSIFSMDGIPSFNYGNDIYGMGMGDTGMADAYRINTGYGNPALATTANHVIFATGIQMGYSYYKDRQGRDYRDNSLDFPFFSIVVPLEKHRFGFLFNSTAAGLLENQQYNSEYSFTESRLTDQYLYHADLLYGIKLPFLNAGVALNYYIGHSDQTITQTYDDASDFVSVYEVVHSFKNPGFTIGVQKSFAKSSWALSYSSQADLKGGLEYKTTNTTEDLGNQTFSLPNRFSAGTTVLLGRNFRSNIEMHYDLWKATDSDVYTENSWKVGAGIAYEPSFSDDEFMKRLPVRGGVAYRLLPITSNDKKIYETSASMGWSLPLKSPDNRLDMGITWTKRGNKSDNGKEEQTLMFLFGTSGFDILTKAFTREAPRDIPEKENAD